MGGLTTHVLDLVRGGPAAGMKIDLYGLRPQRALLRTVQTNRDGRTDEALLPAGELAAGTYEIVFHVGDYFAAQQLSSFFDVVPVRFTILDAAAHYHVPLLAAPWGYSTYRGS